MRRPLSLALAAACFLVAGRSRADVSSPHPGMTLVTQPGRAMVVADLCAAGVTVRATRYDERKKTAQQWGQSLGLQAAINADFFDFPDATLVNGRARGDGEEWPADKQNFENRPYWQFGVGQANVVMDANTPAAALVTEIVGGHNLIIDKGQPNAYAKPLLDTVHRRTAVGISEDMRTLYLMASDNLLDAKGMIDYLVALAAEAGAPPIYYATNMDGGGSSELWVDGPGFVIPSTRLVANHLGVWATGNGPPLNCVPKYAAAFVSQTFAPSQDPPIVLAVGESLEGSFDLTNVGTATWKTGTTKLAPIPRDKPSPLADASWPVPHRAAHVDADTAPGATGHFAVTLHGNTEGDYLQFFGLVEEGVTWFADPTLGGGPPDDFIAVHVVVKPASGASGAGGDGVGAGAGGAGAGGGGGPSAANGGDIETGCDCASVGLGEDASGRSPSGPWPLLVLVLGSCWRLRCSAPGPRPCRRTRPAPARTVRRSRACTCSRRASR